MKFPRFMIITLNWISQPSAFCPRRHGIFPTYISAKMYLSCPHSHSHSHEIGRNRCPSPLGEENFRRANENQLSPNSMINPLSSAEIQRANELLPSLCQNGHLQVALDLINATLQAGYPLNSLNLDAFIDALCKEHKMVHARKFMSEIKREKYNADTLLSLYRMLIDGYCKNSKLIEAMKLLHEMIRSGDPHCHPDASIFATVVEGCCRAKRLCEAIRVLRQMLDRSFPVNPDTQMILFRSLLREARVREADKLQQILGPLGEDPDCSPAKIREAVDMLDQMLDNWPD